MRSWFGRTLRRCAVAAAAGMVLVATAAGATAQGCGSNGAGFGAWLAQYKARAQSQGISAQTIAAALADVSYDPTVIRLDRSQRSFKLSFEQFYARRVSSSLMSRGRRLMAQHKGLLDRIESRFGVPAPVLVSIWGLETNYGSDTSGRFSILRSLATLAYDCRRTDFFTNELNHALKIVQRRDMSPAEMRGGWAGEIGPMQFMASSYYKFAIDFDGDGRRNLMSSTADMLASTANYLKSYGWQRGGSWEPGSHNYSVIREWNKAEVYQRTISVMATRMAGR